MKILRYITLASFALCCAASCSRPSAHSDDAGLSVAAFWEDPADGDTEISEVEAWIYGSDGKLVAESGAADAGSLARKLFRLGAGRYMVVAAVNMIPPFTVSGKEDSWTMQFSMESPVSDAHAFCGAVEVEMGKSGGTVTAETPMRRMLAELAVEMEGAPEGLALELQVMNASSGVCPAAGTGGGNLVGPSHETAEPELPPYIFRNGNTMTDTYLLMPTADGYESSQFMILMRRQDGTVFESAVASPVMEMAGKYLMRLKYDEMQPFMRLTACSIADWTEGWIYSGEITDPS